MVRARVEAWQDPRTTMALGLRYLNHAAMLLDFGAVKLLSDPWFEGTAFSNGWGLEYDNPDAWEAAESATHLWISHWHSDHLHAPTLQKLAARNPGLCVLANVSANFSMAERMQGLGFANVVPVPEREPVALGHGVRVTRYPTAGIDNMLHVAGAGWSVLNYNDCNLPLRALRAVCRRVGPVDVLLTNYNHAGKLFDAAGDAQIKDQFWSALVRVADAVAPRVVVPFASSHYYRTSWSRAQNASLLSFDDVAARAARDPRFLVLRVGDAARVDAAGHVERAPRTPALAPAAHDVYDYGASIAWDELIAAAAARSTSLSRNFPLLGALSPALRVLLADLDRAIELRVGAPPREVARERADIATHSRALHDWLGRRFGDDTFFAGAHFETRGGDTRAIRAWALFTLLEGSHLDPRSLLGYLQSGAGRRFLWNRAEEAWATLVGFQFKAGQLRV
jgi:L-ascorbate metabolism protein UlaG (beta-lactamase superfamily)